jgi:hypothetical protein
VTSWIVVALAAAVCGGVIGFVQGFAMTAHGDVMSGIRVPTRYRLLGMFARPSSELTSAETLLVFAMILGWCAVFLGLCMLPFWVAGHLQLDDALFTIAVSALVAYIVSSKVGKYVWGRVSNRIA